jgi:hypothetical protein
MNFKLEKGNAYLEESNKKQIFLLLTILAPDIERVSAGDSQIGQLILAYNTGVPL